MARSRRSNRSAIGCANPAIGAGTQSGGQSTGRVEGGKRPAEIGPKRGGTAEIAWSGGSAPSAGSHEPSQDRAAGQRDSQIDERSGDEGIYQAGANGKDQVALRRPV